MEKPGNASNSWHPLRIIIWSVRLILFGASAFRTAAKNLEISFDTMPELRKYVAPSFTTIKRWLQKVGYYKLKRAKVVASDWMILIDASIQMGVQKCVLVLGCRKADLPKDRALKLEDLEVLDLRVVSNLNANVITEVIDTVGSKIGKITSICSDRGSDILRGVKDYQADNPDTRHNSDTAHRVANFLKAILEKSERWKKFRENVTQARRKMQNSLVSGALPPSSRMKARYMNVDELIEWAAEKLVLLDANVSTKHFNIDKLRKYLYWLTDFRDEIYYWNRIISIGAIARELVRTENIHINIVDHFEEAIAPIAIGPKELRFADQISLFLLEQTRGLKPGEYLLGSTEILESVFVLQIMVFNLLPLLASWTRWPKQY